MVSIATSVVGKPSFTSRASTVFTDFLSEEQRVEDLTNEELLRTVKNIQTANRQIFLENELFERYLKRMDPALLLGFDKLVEQTTAAANAQLRAQAIASSMLHPTMSATMSMSISNLSRRGTEGSLESQIGLPTLPATNKSYSVMKFGTTSMMDRGLRINTSYKIEMISREMEELRLELERLRKHCTRRQAEVRAEIEQLSLMIKEVKDSDEELTRNIIVGAIDTLTHTIPAEKFIRHMEEWFKRADSMVGKLRLKTSTFRSWNVRLQTQLVQKLELGTTLHPVDFDQLKIDNSEQIKKIDQKNRHLIELKTMAGRCNLKLVNCKDRLAKELKDLAAIQDSIASKRALIQKLLEEEQRVEVEMEKADTELRKVKHRRETFTVPPVLEYARKRDELTKLRKELKVWTRRFNVQHSALVACVRAIQRTAPRTINPNAYLRKKTDLSPEMNHVESPSISPQQSSSEQLNVKKDSITSQPPPNVVNTYQYSFDLDIKTQKNLHRSLSPMSAFEKEMLSSKKSYDRFTTFF